MNSVLRIITLICLMCFSQVAFSMEDLSDYLIVDGDTIETRSFPLEERFHNNNRPLFLFSEEFLVEYKVKDYSAYWELRNDSLFLNKIIVGKESIPLFKLFKKANNDVFAQWFNDSIITHTGELITFHRNESENIYKFSNGLKTELISNSYSIYKQSEFTKDWKKLKNFISRNIDYSKLDEPYEKARVYVRIVSVTNEGKIDSVNIARGWDEIRDREAMRVVKLIPNWTVTHKNGKHFDEQWALPVVFGEAMK